MATIVIPWIFSICAVIGGIVSFSVQTAQANKRPFLEKQLELCFQACDIAARLATETDKEKWEAARQEFWRLYWGRLAIVEDKEVECDMVVLGELIPEKPVSSPRLPMDELCNPSLKLAHDVRALIARTWDVPLPPIFSKTEEEEEKAG
jgi:hypothetical protein